MDYKTFTKLQLVQTIKDKEENFLRAMDLYRRKLDENRNLTDKISQLESYTKILTKEKNNLSEVLTDKIDELENLYKQEYIQRKSKEKYRYISKERKIENNELKKQIADLKKENRKLRQKNNELRIEIEAWE